MKMNVKLPFVDEQAVCALKDNTASCIASIDDRITDLENAINKKPEVAPETKSRFRAVNDEIVLDICKDGFITDTYALLPDIAGVRHIDDENGVPKVVFVQFADNTTTKAVIHENDLSIGSMETAISICITKKLLDARSDGHGSAAYNKIIRHAMKVMYENEEHERRMRQEEEAQRKRAVKQAEKRMQKAMEREKAFMGSVAEVISMGIVHALSQLLDDREAGETA